MGVDGLDELQGDTQSSDTSTNVDPNTNNEPTPPSEETSVTDPAPTETPTTPNVPSEASSEPQEATGAPSEGLATDSPEDIITARENFEAQVRAEHAQHRMTRADIEDEYAQNKAQLEADYQTAIDDLKLGRAGQIAALDLKRASDLETAGLNPSGSDPRRYPENNPQGSFSV